MESRFRSGQGTIRTFQTVRDSPKQYIISKKIQYFSVPIEVGIAAIGENLKALDRTAKNMT